MMFDRDKIYREDIDKFPTLSTYLKNLDHLRKYDYSKCTIDEIGELFYDYATTFPQAFFTQIPDRFNKHNFYRVRLDVNTKTEDINLIQTYKYPPISACNKNGRANIKGKSVFYCSNKALTAIPQLSEVYKSKRLGEVFTSSFYFGSICYINMYVFNTYSSSSCRT